MKDFITIQEFMRKELNLSGNELLVYAIIYGFSKDGESNFFGSRQYLADWCGISIRQVQTILNNLVERNLITKIEEFRNNIKLCRYVANFTSSEKTSLGSEKTSLNNIDNNINIVSNNKLLDIQEKPKKKLNLYDKCVLEIEIRYVNNEELRIALVEYLKVRLALSVPLYNVNQWKAILNKLDELGDRIDIVKRSTEKGWASFYPLEEKHNSKYTGNNAFGENGVESNNAGGERSEESF